MRSHMYNGTAPQLPITDLEAKHYYHGLYSKPLLVARTGNDIWAPPTGPEAFLNPKHLRPVGNHRLKDIWQEKLCPLILNILWSQDIEWTSVDVTRIGLVTQSCPPVCIWIGVKPATLTRQDGITVAVACKEVLVAYNIDDIEVEIREAIVTPYIAPKLFHPVDSTDPTAELRQPLTPALGVGICNTTTPDAEGTGGFYVTDYKANLYLVTARHVVFKADQNNNNIYLHESNDQPRVNVAVMGHTSFESYLHQIDADIRYKNIIVNIQGKRVLYAQEGHHGMSKVEVADVIASAVQKRTKAVYAIRALMKLKEEVESAWTNIDNRVLGYVHFAPPIKFNSGPNSYTEDYALIRMDESKIDYTNFNGKVINLGTKIAPARFTQLMSTHMVDNNQFEYPANRLFPIQGIIPVYDIRHPPILDDNDNMCHVVMKRGRTTGLTIGLANNILSAVRSYFGPDHHAFSWEWPIQALDHKSGVFSKPGDSGSAIIDSHGRLGGLLTGGSGLTDSTDITYATPIEYIMTSLKEHGFQVTVNTNLTV